MHSSRAQGSGGRRSPRLVRTADLTMRAVRDLFRIAPKPRGRLGLCRGRSPLDASGDPDAGERPLSKTLSDMTSLTPAHRLSMTPSVSASSAQRNRSSGSLWDTRKFVLSRNPLDPDTVHFMWVKVRAYLFLWALLLFRSATVFAHLGRGVTITVCSNGHVEVEEWPGGHPAVAQ